MTTTLPDLPATFTTVVNLLEAAVIYPVYGHGAPADVDSTRPWIVAQLVPGGGPTGTATRPSGSWRISLRVIGAARTPNKQGQPTPAVYDAAQAAAQAARNALLDVALWNTAGVSAIDLTGAFGIDEESDVVNVTDDYTIWIPDEC